MLGGHERAAAVQRVEPPRAEDRPLARADAVDPATPPHDEVAEANRLDRPLAAVGHEDHGAGRKAGFLGLRLARPVPQMTEVERRVASWRANRLAPQSKRRRFLCVGAMVRFRSLPGCAAPGR